MPPLLLELEMAFMMCYLNAFVFLHGETESQVCSDLPMVLSKLDTSRNTSSQISPPCFALEVQHLLNSQQEGGEDKCCCTTAHDLQHHRFLSDPCVTSSKQSESSERRYSRKRDRGQRERLRTVGSPTGIPNKIKVCFDIVFKQVHERDHIQLWPDVQN